MVPVFIRPLSKAYCTVSYNASSRMPSVIRFFEFCEKVGNDHFRVRPTRVSTDRSYSYFKNSSLNIISDSFVGRPKFSQYCFRSIGFTKLKSMFFSFSVKSN